jgi:hypothetical protein
METQNNIKDLPKLSVYRYENFFNIYNDTESDMRFYNLLRNINIFPSENSQIEGEYVVDYNDTWVSISYKIYGTMELWWILCSYNQIINPIKMPDAGTKIKYLKSEYIYIILNEIKSQIKN